MGYFDKGQLRPDSARPSLRPPPDYTRRSVKWRIFVLVASLMVVLAIAERARDKNTWNWLWQLDQRATTEDAAVTNRLEPERTVGDAEPLGTFVAKSDSKVEASPPEAEASFEPRERAWSQGWNDVYQMLEPQERTLVFQWLHYAREGQALPGLQREAAAALLSKLDTLWKDYQAAAFQSIVNLSEADQKLWTDVLRHVNQRWSGEVHAALQAKLDGPINSEQEQALAEWQRTLDEVNLQLVQDDRVFVPSDKEILFRLLGRARQSPSRDLRKQSVGRVSYLQLFKQPKQYRGKAVTVFGTAKLAYHVEAPPNHLGISGYYVYWIHPNDGPNSPVVVYALETPVGFPEIKDRDKDGGVTPLHEQVEVTGYFLKRWAYRGKDGTYTAPLILARVPLWDAEQSKLAHAAGRTNLQTSEILTAISIALGLSLAAFGLIYWYVRRRDRIIRQPENPQEEAAAINALQNIELRPSTSEALQQLSREAQNKTVR